MPKVSVIIPVYKVEKYIERCVRSLFEQTLDDIEYIFVNDCTPDKSVEIIKSLLIEYPQREPFVHIINHEQNRGLTKTRNTGLAIATGDYIAHCDSDDWVDVCMYEKLYNHAINTNSDIVYSDLYLVFEDKTEIYKSASYHADKNGLLRNYISSVWTSLVNMIVKKTIYENHRLKSPEHICYCEDFWLSVRLFYYSKKITKISEPLYYYYQCNNLSIMHHLNNYKGDDLNSYLETIELFSKNGDIKHFEKVMSWRVLNAFHFDMYFPEKHKKLTQIYPSCHNYILSCPFYTRKQKIMMWLLTHKGRFLVLIFIYIRNLLGRSL